MLGDRTPQELKFNDLLYFIFSLINNSLKYDFLYVYLETFTNEYKLIYIHIIINIIY